MFLTQIVKLNHSWRLPGAKFSFTFSQIPSCALMIEQMGEKRKRLRYSIMLL